MRTPRYVAVEDSNGWYVLDQQEHEALSGAQEQGESEQSARARARELNREHARAMWTALRRQLRHPRLRL